MSSFVCLRVCRVRLLGIRQHQKGKGNGEWKRWYDEFYSEGAKTGWIDHYNNIENRRKSLEKHDQATG